MSAVGALGEGRDVGSWLVCGTRTDAPHSVGLGLAGIGVLMYAGLPDAKAATRRVLLQALLVGDLAHLALVYSLENGYKHWTTQGQAAASVAFFLTRCAFLLGWVPME